MATNTVLVQAMADPERQWELALIDEFLRARGLDAHTLHSLPEHEAERVLAEASVGASAKLAEVEARVGAGALIARTVLMGGRLT